MSHRRRIPSVGEVIVSQNLTKRYGEKTVVDDLSFTDWELNT
jgi:hypothetical protein